MEERNLVLKDLATKDEIKDEDHLFCLSLVNEIKKIPEDKRLKAKIDIYNIISQYQNINSPAASSSRNYWSPQQQYQYHQPSPAVSSDESQVDLFLNLSILDVYTTHVCNISAYVLFLRVY